MAITVLNPQATSPSATATSETLASYAVPAGDNKILVVGVAIKRNGTTSAATISSVTHNGVAMTQRAITGDSSGAHYQRIAWYDLQLGSTTPSGNIVVTLNASSEIGIIAATLVGARQAAPETTATSITTVGTNSITAILPETMLLDLAVVGSDTSTLTAPDAGQTDFGVVAYNASVGGHRARASYKALSSAGSASMGWDYTGTGKQHHAIVAYNDATFAQETITTTGSGSWTVPTGVTSVIVEAWGGGQSGARDPGGTYDGGEGGAYARSTISVTPGASISYFVGSGGASNSGFSPYRNNGSSSWFSTSTTVRAKGGGSADTTIGTQTAAGGAGGQRFGSPGPAGGSSASGKYNVNAEPGVDGGTSSATGPNPFYVAPDGGKGGNGSTGSGGSGTAPGGGGGGGPTSGGAGSRGQIRLTYVVSSSAATITGSGASTISVTSTGSANWSDPTVTGEGASTVSIASTGEATYTPPTLTGSGSSTIEIVSSGSADFTPEAITGSGSSTIAISSIAEASMGAGGSGAATVSISSTGTAEHSIPVMTGSGASVIAPISAGSGATWASAEIVSGSLVTSSSTTFTVNASAGTKQAIVVVISAFDAASSDSTITGVTHGGTAMTRVITATRGIENGVIYSGGRQSTAHIFALPIGDAAKSGSVSITATNLGGLVAHAFVVKNARQSFTTGTNYTSGTTGNPASYSVSNSPGALSLGVITQGAAFVGLAATATGQTLVANTHSDVNFTDGPTLATSTSNVTPTASFGWTTSDNSINNAGYIAWTAPSHLETATASGSSTIAVVSSGSGGFFEYSGIGASTIAVTSTGSANHINVAASGASTIAVASTGSANQAFGEGVSTIVPTSTGSAHHVNNFGSGASTIEVTSVGESFHAPALASGASTIEITSTGSAVQGTTAQGTNTIAITSSGAGVQGTTAQAASTIVVTSAATVVVGATGQGAKTIAVTSAGLAGHGVGGQGANSITVTSQGLGLFDAVSATGTSTIVVSTLGKAFFGVVSAIQTPANSRGTAPATTGEGSVTGTSMTGTAGGGGSRTGTARRG